MPRLSPPLRRISAKSKAGLLANGSSSSFPSQHNASGYKGLSPFTVAGAAADFHRFPY